MPRLLILYSAQSAVSGIGSWVYTLANQLPKLGWHVTVALSEGRRFHQPEQIEHQWPDLNMVRMNARTGTVDARRLSVLSAISRSRPDIVLSTLLDDGLRTAELAKKNDMGGVRFAVANHGNDVNHLAAILEASQSLDLVATVNKASYQLLRDWPDANWNARLCCIPNAVPAPTSVQNSFTGTLRIGFVGRLTQDKGVQCIPQIVEQLTESQTPFELHVAGEGRDQQIIEDLQQRSSQVFYHGSMSRTALYEQIYPGLDAILCCSPTEGWPMSLAEAMIHGAVPVTSAYTGISIEGVIRHQQTGLVFPFGDTRTAASYLNALLDTTLRQRLSAAARTEISARFSLKTFADAWDHALCHCLGSDAPGTRRCSLKFLPVRSRIKEFIRRSLRRYINHQSARGEWPMMMPRRQQLTEEVRARLEQQDCSHAEQSQTSAVARVPQP